VRRAVGRLTRVALACCAVALAEAGPAVAQSALDSIAKVRLEAAYALAAQIQDTVWPGLSRAPFGTLYVDSVREYAIGVGDLPDSFVPLSGVRIAGRDVATRAREFPPNLLATFPAFSRIPIIVIGSPEATHMTSTAWILTFLHEHFHQLQMADTGYVPAIRGLDLARGDSTGMWQLNFAFPYDSATVQAAFAAAARQLATAIRTPSVAGRAMFWRRYDTLLGRLSAPDQRYLAFQLWQEGVARYVELRAAQTAARSFVPSAAFRSLPDYQPAAEVASRMRERILAALDTADLAGDRRVNFYAFGAGVALLLDQTGPEWRTAYLSRMFDLRPPEMGTVRGLR
jgi:hypothetical protein